MEAGAHLSGADARGLGTNPSLQQKRQTGKIPIVGPKLGVGFFGETVPVLCYPSQYWSFYPFCGEAVHLVFRSLSKKKK